MIVLLYNDGFIGTSLKLSKTSSIALLVWRLATRDGRRVIDNQNSGRSHWIRVALGSRVRSARRSSLTNILERRVAWRHEETAKGFGTKFRLATREVRQAILGAELDREEDF